ncbi:hypothetical protein [Intestinirhabdus alba]|jgi:hypothetical protein|uniref:DUF2975 domain-containing protein n=1 Tax=Intestinirhabdus alba TaxID=2899544 RepID=A0A6L6IKD9_9ENTR|nr:hypothetical protein [Intestinirhabdus alba]MTH45510.1 hypothetical protein [Intestinirhabdus alba]
MKNAPLQWPFESSGKPLPARIRYLCMLVCILLAASALVELWIELEGWFSGEALPNIYAGYRQFYPELDGYSVSGWKVYAATLFLDLLGFIPYYGALILAAVIFYRFKCGIFWDTVNITLLKINSFLILFDACFPSIKDTLQMLSFTAAGKIILTLSYGISAEGVRSFIIGLAIYTFSAILNSAKELADDHKLII